MCRIQIVEFNQIGLQSSSHTRIFNVKFQIFWFFKNYYTHCAFAMYSFLMMSSVSSSHRALICSKVPPWSFAKRSNAAYTPPNFRICAQLNNALKRNALKFGIFYQYICMYQNAKLIFHCTCLYVDEDIVGKKNKSRSRWKIIFGAIHK